MATSRVAGEVAISVPSLQDIENAESSLTINQLCVSCLKLYGELFEELTNISVDDGRRNNFDSISSLKVVQDERSRYRAWATNIAALHKSRLHTSLDHRLKDSPETRNLVLKVLGESLESLQSGALLFR